MNSSQSRQASVASLIGGGSEGEELPSYLWRNGELVAWKDATIQVHDFVYAAPSIVFEGIKAYHGERGLAVFRLDEHIARLFGSMKMLRMRPGKDRDAMRTGFIDLLKANQFQEDVYIVAVAFWGGGGLSRAFSAPEPDRPVELYIMARPFKSQLSSGIALECCTASWRKVSDAMAPPRVKAVANYHNWRLAYAEATVAGYDSFLMLGADGRVAEGPGACVFLRRGDELITPDKVSGILEGITRDAVLKLVGAELKLTVVERAVDRSELYLSTEAFFAGTGLEIAPIVSLDRIPIGDGEIGPTTMALQRTYDDVVRGRMSRYHGWLTFVT